MSDLMRDRDGRIRDMERHGTMSPVTTVRGRERSRSVTRVPHRSTSRSVSATRRYERRYRSTSQSRGEREGSYSKGSRRRYEGARDPPGPNKCLGVFGLSLRTTERDLRDVFTRYGPIDECTVVVDAQTGRSRGFAFIYFAVLDDAETAKEACNGIEIDGRVIRVDFSITQRAHTPTPGVYMGKVSQVSRRRGNYGPSYNGSYNSRRPNYRRSSGGDSMNREGYRHDYDRHYSRRRSPSPYSRSHRHGSRSNSFSPRHSRYY